MLFILMLKYIFESVQSIGADRITHTYYKFIVVWLTPGIFDEIIHVFLENLGFHL